MEQLHQQRKVLGYTIKTHTNMHVLVSACIHVCACLCMYAFVYVCVCGCMCVCAYTHMCVHQVFSDIMLFISICLFIGTVTFDYP